MPTTADPLRQSGSHAVTVFHWLLLGDAVLIAADLLQRNGVLSDVRFLVTHEAGFGEFFQWGKASLGVVMLATLAVRRTSVSALMWAVALLVALLDDSLTLHERTGDYLAVVAGLPSIGALRANQVGELLFYACAGVLCAVALGVGWRYGDPEDHRLSRTLLFWFAALGFCAVFLDAVASLTRRSRFGPAFAMLDDGGEMIVMSFLVISAWRGLRSARPGAPDPFPIL